ncbi:hypothetical protein Poly21_52630 [Allorhodopirellula heiligendammensis]|uniref:Uncharacterized protein n=1 Tax=Allorhodopirellula heiligendammensis TaxID=2714739 RepID=A0A5C6BCI8_9BACT|nr:hypothetical protein Poly21_52630 [Allorhodopirellula heiligendammensis]
MSELFDGCFVSTVATFGPQRMSCIEWSIVKNLIVDGARRERDETAGSR